MLYGYDVILIEQLNLMEGQDMALLIDTGFGAGNLRGFVEKLTNKPIIVANMHFHPDHAAGNGEFERAYMSEGARWDAPSVYNSGAVPFDITRLPHADYEKIYVGEGDRIELGGRTIEVLDVLPAHCNSSLFFFDRAHRMFFCGDELEAAQVNLFDNSKNPGAPYDGEERLQNFKKNCERIQSLSPEFDFLLPNHNGAPIAKSYIEDYIGLVDAIFAGKAVVEEKLNHPYIEMDEQAAKLCRVRWKWASIFIYRDVIRSLYGKAR